MSKFPISAALAALVIVSLVVSVSPAQAPTGNVYRPAAPVAQPQQPTAPYIAVPIAVLDVGRVFQENARLKSQQQALDAEATEIRNELNAKQEQIRKRREVLRSYRPGTPEYEQIDTETTKAQADLEVEARLKDKQLGQKLATILHDAYREVEQEVAAIAATRGFIMVMRFNGQRVTPERRDLLSYYLNKDMVWYDPRLDITQEVIERLKQRSAYSGTNVGSANGRPGIPMQPTRTR